MLKLRPHHLLCTLTYIGRGYSPAFTTNMDAVCARLCAGESVLIVSGPDDICAPLHNSEHDHCHAASVTARDAAAAAALSLVVGTSLTPRDHLIRWRKEFAAGTIRRACTGCPWQGLCTEIAASGFAGTKFTTPG
ncbi:MAG: DUF1284 domain-containing protein [Rhizomicrobium sp.]